MQVDTADQAIARWAEYRRYGSCRGRVMPAGYPSGDAQPAPDEEASFAAYVESTTHFREAEPALLILHGLARGDAPTLAQLRVVVRFGRSLTRKLAATPWTAPRRPEMDCEEDLIRAVVAAQADLDDSLRRLRRQ